MNAATLRRKRERASYLTSRLRELICYSQQLLSSARERRSDLDFLRHVGR
jgi:hypothetical protein